LTNWDTVSFLKKECAAFSAIVDELGNDEYYEGAESNTGFVEINSSDSS